MPARTRKAAPRSPPSRVIERVQVGVRIEKRLVKVLKGLAEALDLTLADLLEGMVLHALENAPPFQPSTLRRIQKLREIYGLDLGPGDAHRLREVADEPSP